MIFIKWTTVCHYNKNTIKRGFGLWGSFAEIVYKLSSSFPTTSTQHFWRHGSSGDWKFWLQLHQRTARCKCKCWEETPYLKSLPLMLDASIASSYEGIKSNWHNYPSPTWVNPPLPDPGLFTIDSEAVRGANSSFAIRLMSTSAGQDSCLGIIEYSLHALHYVSTSKILVGLQRRLQRRLASIVQHERLNPPSGRSNIVNKPVSSPSFSPFLSLSELVSDARYTTRLLGLVALWAEGSNIALSPRNDSMSYILAVLQVTSGITYQILENIAYLGSKEKIPHRWLEKWGKIGLWYLWGVRALLVHVLIYLMKLYRERKLKEDKYPIFLSVGKHPGGTHEALEEKSLQDHEAQRWRQSFSSALIWALLCFHWSRPSGIGIPDKVIGGLSLSAELSGLRW